jgi:para-aminobenzoate synthetase component 1
MGMLSDSEFKIRSDTQPALAPDRAYFERLVAKGYNKVPLYLKIPTNDRSVTSVYQSVKGADTILLQSSRITSSDGRYSIIGHDPFMTFKGKGKQYWIDGVSETGDPIQKLSELLNQWRGIRLEGLPLCYGGALGYFSYECNHYFERLPVHPNDDINIPDVYFLFFDKLIIFDHIEEEIFLIATGDNYAVCADKVETLRTIIATDPKDNRLTQFDFSPNLTNQPESNFDLQSYIRAIQKIKAYIHSGDTYQVNLSQRFQLPINRAPFDIYRRLCKINPVHFASFFDCGDFYIISGSPERLIRVENNRIQTRPIAGTRRRGTKQEDAQFIRELKTNEKEQAEHAMLVDLERNDLGRVCEYGSIKVTSLMEPIKYSHVTHLESLIEGILKPEMTTTDVIAAVFPGGTITGAPKIRTMEIITELEPNVRGIYTGSIGHINFSNEMDFNIVIRTILIKNNTAYIQAGGGIVQDAIPEQEYKETLYKAQAQLEAI